MTGRRTPSLSVPITLGSVAVPLAIALLVGWTVIFTSRIAAREEIASEVWLLVLGLVAFLVILFVLVFFSIFLVREILEVRRKDSFIDSVTHELKSPLASIKLCLQTLEREGLAPEQKDSLRAMMLADVDRLTSFIDDVLQANRLAYDKVGLDLSEVGIAELAESCAETVRRRRGIAEEGITLEIDPALRATTDRAALEVVLRNLLDNAVKYSDGAPEVRVEARVERGRRIVIEVHDRGIGIPPAELRRVFDRFYRGADEGVRKRKGTGLGLFVVSALIKNLGGDVEAESEGKGRGTTFRLLLPIRR